MAAAANFFTVALWERVSFHGGWRLGRVLRRYTDWVLSREEK